MLRWSEDQLREHHAKRQGRVEANQEARQHQKEQKRPKYRNRKVQIDGRVFDSEAEGARYVELKRLQEAGVVSGLKCQVSFNLVVNGSLVCKYVCDFIYVDSAGRRIVEDVKGMKTREYQIKKKLMRAVHGIDIHEVSKVRKSNKHV